MNDDNELLAEIIFAANDPDRVSKLLFNYYDNLDRAERTDRWIMYLHIGILSGIVRKFIEESDAKRA